MAQKLADDRTQSSEDQETKAVRTRARIVSAAAQVLSEKGYAGTRLSDVARVADLQAPAIYYYFDSREALIEEVVRSGSALIREEVSQVLDQLPDGTPPMDRIEAAVAAHLEYVLHASDLTTASIRNSGQLPEEMRARQLAEQESYGNVWRQLFKDAEAAGDLRPELDTHAARMLVIGALNWAAEWWNPKRGSLDDVIATAQSLVRHGLSPRSARKRRQPTTPHLG
ncbi:TetR/AcrR family transcriptional regulator [Rhodococcus opacus]|uniref:TetR/AcrR family transcriptional regulator n=1 Tax=Rhodococcus opacus TaxID=37919 RepID=UPI00294A7CA3|nr:TetR/AcrR family transcriptional regulator [Rhodococcus opacus]MDV6247216.1 TetR/AcrR family transcriptional regulator [Rhodococcus opacus]